MANKEFVKELKQEIAKYEIEIKDIGNRSRFFGAPRRVMLLGDSCLVKI